MEAVAEGLWGLAEHHEKTGQIETAIKCLEAICQSRISFLPVIEAKTRLHVAILLLRHTHNLNQAKSHLERAQLLLNSIPSCFDLKCRAFSLLSHCYHLLGSIPPQKQILYKALHLTSNAPPDVSVHLWSCNFNSQLANALVIEGDYQTSLTALESGFLSATQIAYPDLQMFFTTSILHVHLMLWSDENSVDLAIRRCEEVSKTIHPDRRANCFGLFFYYELLNVFYRLSICDYKNASHHLDKLDAAVKADSEKMREAKQLTNELNAVNQSLSRSDLPSRERSALIARQAQLQERIGNKTMTSSAGKQSLESEFIGSTRQLLEDKLVMAPAPMNGEWLPKSAAFALIDLMVVVFGRPKGNFKECEKRIHSGMLTIQEELLKLGITDGIGEVDLQHSVMRMASVYLTLLMQFLENKVAVELTRSEFVEAQEALVQMKSWFTRFPTILQACESSIEMLRGQYAHSVGCYSEAAFHYVEAAKQTESKSIQIMYRAYAAVSYFCIGDAESSSLALDLIGPIKGMNDSSVGAREKASILFAQGLLLMKQQDLQEARNRLAKGLQIAHNHMGNLQLVSQYLTILGNLALALHDTGQAREILRSSLTLAKKLSDIPTQIWVLSVLAVLYSQLGEKGSEMENNDYRSKKLADLQKRLGDARSSIYHVDIIDKATIEVQQYHELDNKRAIAGQAMRDNLDIPESIGLSTRMPAQSSSRLVDFDIGRRGKRKL